MFRFLTPLSKPNLWVCIFNLMFLLPIILQLTIGVPLCFTDLHFTKNNLCCLRRFMACRSLFYPWMFMFCLKNSYRCFKPLIYTQIVTNATPFSTCSCNTTWSNCLFKLLVTILFSISPYPNSILFYFLH